MKIVPLVALSAAVLVLAASCASAPAKGSEAGTASAAAAPVATAPAAAAPVATAPAAAAPVTAAPEGAVPAATAPAASAAAPLPVVDLQYYKAADKASYAALEKAAGLAAQGKWKSAIAFIDAFDKDSANPYALALKTTLLLKGAVGNQADRSFAVVDLEPGQDLAALRESGQEFELAAFDPPALAEAQSAKGVTAPPVLSCVLGDYYYDVVTNFQDAWEISPFEIAEKAAVQYGASFAGGLYEISSLRKHAEILSGLDRLEEAAPVYNKLLGLDPKDPVSHYGYAMALQRMKKPAEMLAELDIAIGLYGDSSDRFGLVAMASKTAIEMGDAARAEAYLAKTDKELAGTAMASMLRHFVAVSVGNKEASEAAAGKIMDEYGKDNGAVRDLIVIWYQSGATEDAMAFIDKRIASGGESLAIANLEFYKAVLLLQAEMTDERLAAATAAIDDAEKRMKAALPAEDPVFASVASVREALASLGTPPEDAAPPAPPVEEATPPASGSK